MRTIRKGPEPPSLISHRQIPHCDYDNYPDKDLLRSALVAEQFGLCCYCMSRIRNGRTTMKIEHWQCQSRFPDEQLNYRNLLGACLGGEGQPYDLQCCDTHKGDCNLMWNPADPAHHIENRLRYESDGSIRSDDGDFDNQLNEVLNLNLPLLKNNRKSVLDAILSWWKHEKEIRHGPVSRERFERERNRWNGGRHELLPFCQVAIWWLDRRLARMQA